MNYVRYFSTIIFLLFIMGCSPMNGPNEATYQFDVNPNADLSGLRVNLHISGKYSGSDWYSYSKTITMIDGGKVLQRRFKDEGDLIYTIEAFDSKRGHYFHYAEPYEHEGLRADYILSFIFSDVDIQLDTTILKTHYDPSYFYEKIFKYDKNSVDNKQLVFYSPNNTKYKISTVYSQEELEIFDSFSFENFKTIDKLKEEEILRLNLTDEQKQELIKIHSQKEFIEPE